MTTQITNAVCGSYSWSEFAPEFFLIGLAIALLMIDCFWKRFPKHSLGLIGALGALGTAFALQDHMFALLAAVATGLTLLLAHDYSRVTVVSSGDGRTGEGTGEFYVLPLLACAGISALAKAQDLVLLFVALEVLTLSSYVLAGYYRRNHGSVEAGVKYLVLGAVSTGVLVFGAAWYFGMTGSFVMNPMGIASALVGGCPAGILLALALLLVGAGFKVGIFPMHVWIPDVYQGAPTPTTAFLSVASKVAGFALLSAILMPYIMLPAPLSGVSVYILLVVAVLAAATLLVGNLGAIPQTNMKRLLGYSSIAQAGFILPLYFSGSNDYIIFYLAAYLLSTMGAFFALAQVRIHRGSDEISAFRALGKTNPLLAFGVTVCFASLAGVPLTAGFLAKWYSFKTVVAVALAAVPSLFYWLLPIMVICAAAGFYYYFKVIRAMYWEKPLAEDEAVRVPFVTGVVLAVCAAVLIVGGTAPLFII